MSLIFNTNLGWEHPLDLGIQHSKYLDHNYTNNYDYNYSKIETSPPFLFQAQDHKVPQREQSLPQSGSSSQDNYEASMLAKKLNHNASERDRRKKINSLYSSLRSLLPPTDRVENLTIPATVSRALKYIPQVEKQLKDLTHKKNILLSKNSQPLEKTNEEKSKTNNNATKDKKSCTISTNKLRDREIIIQISTLECITLHEVLLKLEKDGLSVLDVSSFSSFGFGGATFYNIHLTIEEGNFVKCDELNEELLFLIQKQS